MRYVTSAIAACVLLASAEGVVISAGQSATAHGSAPTFQTARVDLVLSRFQGEKADKKISSLPYTVYVREGSPTTLMLGNNVPIPTRAESGATSFNYQNVGVNIICRLETAGENQYWLSLNITDSAVAGDTGTMPPVIRSMSLQNTLMLRNGQTLQFGSAVDKITGETLKTEVTLTIVK
ncbi:MAG: hypothetical protein IT184_15885 [Acidobacteria bacterium]|nr:hypothetical protein [Acidobacteriota bacterium]